MVRSYTYAFCAFKRHCGVWRRIICDVWNLQKKIHSFFYWCFFISFDFSRLEEVSRGLDLNLTCEFCDLFIKCIDFEKGQNGFATKWENWFPASWVNTILLKHFFIFIGVFTFNREISPVIFCMDEQRSALIFPYSNNQRQLF